MDKVYLLTGGTSEMGMALLKRLLAHGGPNDHYLVHGHGDLAEAEALAVDYPGQIETFDVDLSDTGAMHAFVDSINARYETITHFAHLPARSMRYIPFMEMDVDRFHSDWQLQLDSAIHICKAVLPKMAKAGYGRVAFMSTSILMGAPPSGTTAYTMVKGAIYAFAKSLASEYGRYNVTVNCVAPAMVDTKFVAQAPAEVKQMMTDTNPMGRLGTPDDVAPAFEFLLSDDARYITGILLPVTGGFDM